MGFRAIPGPFVCCVLLDDTTPDGVLRTMKLAEYEGADAFDLELQGLDPAHRTPQGLKAVFDCATKPIFTVYRRYTLHGATFVANESDEEARMRAQLDLIDLGSIGFDMELDTFDPQPRIPHGTDEGRRYAYERASPPGEISTDPRAVERQMRLIDETHRRGGEIMASSHAMTRLTPEATLRIGRLAEERGADAVKIVQFCADYDDVLDTLAASVLLKRELRIPFVVMAHGEYGKLVRPLAPIFGSMLVFARHDYKPGSFLDQPPVRAMRAMLDNVDFRISRRAEWFLPPEVVASQAAMRDGAALAIAP
jgi:3-dehydroquinate dehydratase